MLRSILINKKKIPVPVPFKVLDELINWLQSYVIKPNETITRIKFDGRDIDFGIDDRICVPSLDLKESSSIDIRVDSPDRVCLQALEALANLCSILERVLKPIAVTCWQGGNRDIPNDLNTLLEDLDLINQLIDHLFLWLDHSIDREALELLNKKIQQEISLLNIAISRSDWRGVARLLLKGVEHTVIQMKRDIGVAQEAIFAITSTPGYQEQALR
jgi:hypothetical protein